VFHFDRDTHLKNLSADTIWKWRSVYLKLANTKYIWHSFHKHNKVVNVKNMLISLKLLNNV
jgi:hypothetical protein